MIEIGAYCSSIEMYPADGPAYESLHGVLSRIDGFDFVFRIHDPSVNQGQMTSNFDERFKEAILSQGASPHSFNLPADIPQKLDFAFRHDGRIVAVEVEKTNREKILRDILKAHMYLHSGADSALLALPKNYSHRHGIWNLYEFGVQRFRECRTYGFGTEERLGRIILPGFEQLDAQTRMPLDAIWREEVRQTAKGTQR